MDKASGVYLTITDNSFTSGGTESMKIIVPMLLNKGAAGITRVTAKTYESLIGYDLSYNSNYYGLKKLLENISYVDVWKLNQNAKVANAFFETTSSDKEFDNDCDTFEEIKNRDPQPVIAVGHKYTGDWQTSAVKFAPTPSIVTQINEQPTSATFQEIVLDDVSKTEKDTFDDMEVYAGCEFYNSSDNSVVGVLSAENDKLYKVVDGEVIKDEITYTKTNTWTDGTNFYDSSMVTMTEPEGDPDTPTSIGNMRLYNSEYYTKSDDYWFKVEGFTSTGFATEATAVTDTDVINALEAASDIAISFVTYTAVASVEDNSIGNAVWKGNKLTIILSATMSKDSFWNIHVIPSTITEWTMTVAKFADDTYTVQNQYDFSTDTSSDIYWEKVDFGDILLFIKGTVPASMTALRSYFTLEGGSNGDASIIAADIDTTVLDSCGDNICLMNGITNYKIANRIAAKCQSLKIHCFVDAPAYTSYIDLEKWAEKITKGEYVAIGAKPDQDEDSDGNIIYVYPSVNYGLIYASMYSNYSSLCYPPAGPSYGIISANDLLETDYENYKNELKTNRINYQTVNSLGSMMWEQRTTYSLNTDLSYIAPVFIVDALSEQIVDFERQFNFRYMTRTDLLNQESGLTNIFDSFVTKNFVYAYEIDMPTFEEAQKAGRTLRIPMKVQVMKDAEVIELELEITNSL